MIRKIHKAEEASGFYRLMKSYSFRGNDLYAEGFVYELQFLGTLVQLCTYFERVCVFLLSKPRMTLMLRAYIAVFCDIEEVQETVTP